MTQRRNEVRSRLVVQIRDNCYRVESTDLRLFGHLHRSRPCAAIIDRLTFNGTIIETGTDSIDSRTVRTHIAKPGTLLSPLSPHPGGLPDAAQRHQL